MRKVKTLLTWSLCLGACAAGFGQGGFQGQYQGPVDRSVDAINRSLADYLNADEIRSILTPGEFVEWKLTLKPGQVVVAEARSDAFDPALEIVDGSGKPLASNDDRYPGDQRPLLLWRCTKEGTYGLHVRCFHDRSGGEFSVRWNTYDSVDLVPGQPVEKEVVGRRPFLLRMSMKAGEIAESIHERVGSSHYPNCSYEATISSSGLPYLRTLDTRIQPAIYAVAAPVTGDYYLVETADQGDDQHGKIRVTMRDVVPTAVSGGGQIPAERPTGTPSLWTMPVKAGQLLEASVPELSRDCRLVVTTAPDYSNIDASKPETNPFYPHPNQNPERVVEFLPKRAQDARETVFLVRQDATLWIATNGAGPKGKAYGLTVKPAATSFAEGQTNVGKLRISDTDYWAFDAKAGDVLTLNATSPTFRDLVTVRDPDLVELRRFEPVLDEPTDNWRMIVQKPGRYLVSVSCVGNGGSGEYTLTRRSIHPKEFGLGAPVHAEIGEGEVQVWRFTVAPHAPVLMHWTSSGWPYDVALYDEKGNRTDFQRDQVDDHTKLGLIYQPRTYVIVLTGNKQKADYAIELTDIPGYRVTK